MIKNMLAILFLLFTTNAFAWFCPNNFNLIQAGDSLATIIQQCGQPQSKTSSKTEPHVPQSWDYYVNTNYAAGAPSSKMTIILDQNGIVTNITVSGVSLSSTSACGGTIAVGNTMANVKGTCGAPSFVTKGENTQGQGADQKIQIDEYTYSGTPPNTLVFENGVLTSRK